MTKRHYPPREVAPQPPAAPRRPVRWANYPGDVTSIIGEIKGPTELGDNDYMDAIEAHYNPGIETTRVGFAVARPQDFARIDGQVEISPAHQAFGQFVTIVKEPS